MDLNERVPGDLDPVLVGLPADVLGEHLPNILQSGHVSSILTYASIGVFRGREQRRAWHPRSSKKEWKKYLKGRIGKM